jgi:hypothetical protein
VRGDQDMDRLKARMTDANCNGTPIGSVWELCSSGCFCAPAFGHSDGGCCSLLVEVWLSRQVGGSKTGWVLCVLSLQDR